MTKKEKTKKEMMKPAEELAEVKSYLLSEFERLYKLENDSVGVAFNVAFSQRCTIARIMTLMGMEFPSMDNLEC